MSFWLYGLYLILTIASMQGCVPIPVPSKLPFGEETLKFIEPGDTDRGEIETILGKPDVERADSSLSIYNQYRTMALLISPYALGEIGTGHILLIHYDTNDLVKTYEILRLGVVGKSLDGYKQACASDGICIVDSPQWGIIVLDRPEMDSEAKLFKVNEDYCSIYLYIKVNFFSTQQIDLCLLQQGTSQTYLFYEGSYFYWQAEPGRVTILADSNPWDTDTCETKYEFECRSGQSYFVQAHGSPGIWKDNSIRFSLANPDEGKQAIIQRRLILP